MKQHYRERDEDMAWEAVDKCFKGKWSRNDVLSDIEEWTGYDRREIWEYQLENPEHAYKIKYEIIEERAMALDDMMDGIEMGIDPDFDPVISSRRPDKGTGKMREIAYLCIRMQLLGHYLQLGLLPLFKARFLPQQHASIPGRGPHRLVRQVYRAMRRKYGIKYYIKSDCKSAYGTTMYARVREMIREDIPRARWIHQGLEVMEQYAPGGHLIIGGFLDAWLFNYVISRAMDYVMHCYTSRRGRDTPVAVACSGYMDDIAFMGTNRKGLQMAVRRCGEYMGREHGIRVVATTGATKLWTAEEEKSHKHRDSPGARGTPMLDMAGYRIGRTHVTMRKRNARKAIRCFSRAWREYQRDGTLRRQRAAQVISWYGPIESTNSKRMKEKYHVYELLRVAKRVVAYWGRADGRKRKEKIKNEVDKYRKQREAEQSDDDHMARRDEACTAGG